jgi:hypothetical protein
MHIQFQLSIEPPGANMLYKRGRGQLFVSVKSTASGSQRRYYLHDSIASPGAFGIRE